MDTDDSCSSLSIALPCDNDQAQSPITPVRNCNLAHTSPGSSSMDLATKGHCTFLILDEDLQRLPFECLELFSGVTVSRIPSLPFAIATLLEAKPASKGMAPYVDPVNARYVIDPESNLANTKSTLLPILNSMSQKK